MIVHGLNKDREIIERKLITKKDGVYLDDTLIEPDADLFFGKIWDPDEKHEGFTNAFYQITNECNKHCDYCYNRYLLLQHPGDTRFEQLVKSLDEFIPDDDRGIMPYKDFSYCPGNPKIGFIGGEPTVTPVLVPFVNHICNTRNNKVYIYTNGLKLLDPLYLDTFENTSQIMFAISTDKNTSPEFLRAVVGNLKQYNFEYGFSIIVGRTEETNKQNLKLNDLMMKFEPQEIRYRAVADQIKGYSDFQSNVMKFIEKARGIKYDDFASNAVMGGRGGMISLMDTADGKVSTALLPTWNQSFAENISKGGSFVINTRCINAPGECHMNSPDLYRWRMTHTKELYVDSLEPVWGKQNPYC
jgi:sulfatase maturation enzyme AslB (radical SAM superfamily)